MMSTPVRWESASCTSMVFQSLGMGTHVGIVCVGYSGMGLGLQFNNETQASRESRDESRAVACTLNIPIYIYIWNSYIIYSGMKHNLCT